MRRHTETESGSQAGYALPTRPLAVGSWLSLPSNTWLPSSHAATVHRQRLRPMRAKAHDPASKTLVGGPLGGVGLCLAVYPFASEPFVYAGCRRTVPPVLGLREPF
jgi:hypothetical protein